MQGGALPIFSFIYMTIKNSGNHRPNSDPLFWRTRQFPTIWLCQGLSCVSKSSGAAIEGIWMDLFLHPVPTSLLPKSLGLDPIHAEKDLLSRYPLPLANVSELSYCILGPISCFLFLRPFSKSSVSIISLFFTSDSVISHPQCSKF